MTAHRHSTFSEQAPAHKTLWPRECLLVVEVDQKSTKGESMKQSTTDQAAGAFHEVKGAAKEKAGQISNNPDLAAEGHAEKAVGTIQKKIGQIEKVFEK
jgi:uncharacterized protein YjbJ (UPF0337 family)